MLFVFRGWQILLELLLRVGVVESVRHLS
jgi:hypothetical protein